MDNNQPLFSGDVDCLAGVPSAGCTGTGSSVTPFQIYPSKTPAYWLVNLDARFNLDKLVGLEKSYFQLNVYNLFDKLFVGGFTAGLNQSVPSTGSSAGQFGFAPFAQIGAPRAVSGTLSVEF